MPEVTKIANQGMNQSIAVQQNPLAIPTKPNAMSISPETAPQANKAAFDKVLNRHTVSEQLLDPQVLEAPLEQLSQQQLQKNANLVPRPTGMQESQALCQLTDHALVQSIMNGSDSQGTKRFHGILRKESDIANSGVLVACRELASRNIEVPASEFNRTISDDSVLVLRGFAHMNANQIHQLKEQAYHHPEVEPEKQAAIDKGYFGSAKHKEFGALVESMTGGILSAEEAMAMCPCGGIPGPGPKEVPLISGVNAVQRHAMRHDALGFLFTRFDVGPGYGSKTTPFGLANDNPMAGQVLGIAREIFKESSVFPDSDHVARSSRFNV